LIFCLFSSHSLELNEIFKNAITAQSIQIPSKISQTWKKIHEQSVMRFSKTILFRYSQLVSISVPFICA
jgi:hypothetical protein